MNYQLMASADLDSTSIQRILCASGLEVGVGDDLVSPGNLANTLLLATSDSGHDALQLVADAMVAAPEAQIVLASPRPTERERRQLFKLGATSLIEPLGFEPSQVAARFLSVLLPDFRKQTSFQGMVGVSCKMVELFNQIERLARFSDPVLILGETGVGKELVAKALHGLGRPGRPWVAMNVAASTDQLVGSDLFGHTAGAFTGADRPRKGLLSEAGDGSILLDEIGDLDSRSQIRLLRLIEERRYRPLGANREQVLNARLLLATHKDLDRLVEEGRFRQDLHERIRGLELRVPPLRERPEDLPLLAAHFLDELSREERVPEPYSISSIGIDLLFRSRWPGNVRELRGALRRAAAFSSSGDGEVSVAILRECSKTKRSLQTDLEGVYFDPAEEVLAVAEARMRRAFLGRALELSENKVPVAAKLAGISRARFYELLKELDISR